MNICVVNYATTNAWYPFGQKRLSKSLNTVGYNGDTLFFNQLNILSPSHDDIPYAFKIYAMREAQKRNYDMILWVDASFWAIRSVVDLFSFIDEKGIVVQDSDYPLGQWSSDSSLELFGISREKAFELPMFAGGLIGLNLHDKNAVSFLDGLYAQAQKGTAFRGCWSNRKQEVSKDNRVLGHRHDMVCGSLIINEMNIEMQPNNSIFSYYGWYEKYKTERNLSGVYFVCEGGMREI